MLRRLIPATLLLVMAAPALAEDKVDAKKLKGTWVREVNNTKISFEFKNENEYLTPGMFVRVRIPYGEPHRTLLVDKNAVCTDQTARVSDRIDSHRTPKTPRPRARNAPIR